MFPSGLVVDRKKNRKVALEVGGPNLSLVLRLFFGR